MAAAVIRALHADPADVRAAIASDPDDDRPSGTIFQRCTGRSVVDALAGNLAQHFFLSARDLGRLGTMLLQNGRWNGRQVVPASWMAQSTSGTGASRRRSAGPCAAQALRRPAHGRVTRAAR